MLIVLVFDVVSLILVCVFVFLGSKQQQPSYLTTFAVVVVVVVSFFFSSFCSFSCSCLVLHVLVLALISPPVKILCFHYPSTVFNVSILLQKASSSLSLFKFV